MTEPYAFPSLRRPGEFLRYLWKSNLGALLANRGLGALSNAILLVLINRFYARDTDAADAGRLAVILTLTLSVVLVACGIGRSLTLRISQARALGVGQEQTIARYLGAGLGLTAALSLVLMALGLAVPWLVLEAIRAWYPSAGSHVEVYVKPLQWAALWLPSYSFIVVLVAVFDGYQRMRWSLLAESGTFQVMRLGGAVVLIVVLGATWTQLVVGWTLAYAIGTALVGMELWVFLSRQRQPVAWNHLAIWPVLRDTIFFFLPTAAPTLVLHIGVLVSWAVGGPGASATFWVMWSLVLVAAEVCSPIGRVLFPAVPNLQRLPDARQFRSVLRRPFWGVSLIALTALALLVVVRGPLLEYLHQGSHRVVLAVLLPAGFLATLRSVFDPVLLAVGKEKALMILEWISLMGILAGGAVAMQGVGLVGLAAAYLLVGIGGTAVRIAFLKAATGVSLWIDVIASGGLVLVGAAVLVAYESGAF